MSARVRTRLLLFFLLVGLAGGAFFAHWWFLGRFLESTDNAYVQADIVRVTSQLAAQVTEVLVEDNQKIEAGTLLVRLDDRDFQVALAQASAQLANREAELAEARSRLVQQDSLIEAAHADVEARQAEHRRIELDIERITPLRQSGYASEEQLSNYRAQLAVARAHIRRARADLRTQTLVKDTLTVDLERYAALILSAQADVDQAQLALERTRIHAPLSGRIGQRSVRPGASIQSGTALLAIVPDTGLWVQANFKETQIRGLREGQRVRLVFDSFPGEPVEGRIDSLFPASGAQFSLLPPENATGNFTKVVQRIPARILVDPEHPLSRRIRPGMSVAVRVDLRD